MNVQGKAIVVTGGSDGIGLAVAGGLARKGGRLALVAREEEKLAIAARAVGEVAPDGSFPLVAACDVTDRSRVFRTLTEIAEKLGAIDVLVCNAGISVYGEVADTPIDAFRDVMETDYFGVVNCIHAVLPAMRRRGGVIVNVASAAAVYGLPCLGAYGAAKAALATLSQSLRAELADSDVNVLVVYPGYTETDLFRKERVFGGARRPDGVYDPPNDVAAAIVEAIESERAETVLSVDGRRLKRAVRFFPRIVDRKLAELARTVRGGVA